METRTDSNELDRELEMLANQKRREILDYFATNDTETTTIEELSRRFARVRVDGGTGQQPMGIQRDLHHIHLPKLEECGLVEYDSRTGTVRYHPDELVEELVQIVSER